ncbi:MAG: Omp28-related outer membrane protein [Bacteroidota bacterium]
MKDTYGKRLISMELHVGNFATPKADVRYTTDYRTPIGDAINAQFSISSGIGVPAGLVNRYVGNGLRGKTKDEWRSVAAQQLARTAIARIDLEASYTESSKQIKLEASTEFLDTTSLTTKMVAYIVEDSLVGWQTDYRRTGDEQHVANFVHRHVLRGSMNAAFGEDLTTDSSQKGRKVSKSWTAALPANVKEPKHVSVIVVLYDAVSFEVINVNEVEILH